MNVSVPAGDALVGAAIARFLAPVARDLLAAMQPRPPTSRFSIGLPKNDGTNR
jgi:hypothetical protein